MLLLVWGYPRLRPSNTGYTLLFLFFVLHETRERIRHQISGVGVAGGLCRADADRHRTMRPRKAAECIEDARRFASPVRLSVPASLRRTVNPRCWRSRLPSNSITQQAALTITWAAAPDCHRNPRGVVCGCRADHSCGAAAAVRSARSVGGRNFGWRDCAIAIGCVYRKARIVVQYKSFERRSLWMRAQSQPEDSCGPRSQCSTNARAENGHGRAVVALGKSSMTLRRSI